MTPNTSAVAVCCSSASSRSRLARFSCSCSSAADELLRRATVGALRRLGFVALRRRALTALPPVVARRFIKARPHGLGDRILAQTSALIGLRPASIAGQAMSALPPKADIRWLGCDVR